VGLLLIGALVSIVLLLRHSQPLIAALFVVGVVVVGLSSRANPSSLLGKWIVIVAAAVAAVPLVAWASER
jgi:hypothetical protein